MIFLIISILPFFLLFSRALTNFTNTAFSIMASSSKKRCRVSVTDAEKSPEMSVLDLPELALDLVLEKLPPAALCNMAGVCRELRERCTSDHLWRRHMREKWGEVVGDAARREWEWYLANSDAAESESVVSRNWLGSTISCVWPLSWLKESLGCQYKPVCPSPRDTVMSWYLSLEKGKFWFPAQVYNREHGHVGFMLSCYDAELSYNSRTDTFQARYPPHGRRTVVIEEGVEWDRIRAPPLDAPAHDLHASDCLHDLRPGDHIEIQWRRNKEFPYGWWYGIVGHLEPCDGSEHFCRCHNSESVVLEFNQYTPGSRWRKTIVNRRDHREQGNENDGFYGGIRKLYNKNEISTWKRLWPVEVLE